MRFGASNREVTNSESVRSHINIDSTLEMSLEYKRKKETTKRMDDRELHSHLG